MSNIKVKIKGVKQITLNGTYNSLAPYAQYKDDAKMADTTNAFTDYLSSSGCNTNDDKIVIKQLPDKGSLFYLTNPAAPTPVYAVVTLGQSILVKDILINKVLKFQAEGLSDNAFTGTYMTTFKFERLCGIASNNIIASVNLSVVDEMKQYSIKVIQTNISQESSCSSTDITFEISGSLIDHPIRLNEFSSPSGSIISLFKVSGNGIFKKKNDGQEFISSVQPKDGAIRLNRNIDLTFTGSGTSIYILSNLATDTFKNPESKSLEILTCEQNNEYSLQYITSSTATLLNEENNLFTELIKNDNNREMYYKSYIPPQG